MKEPTRSIPRIRLKQVRDGRVKFKVDKVTRPMEVYQAVKPYYKGADREIVRAVCQHPQNPPPPYTTSPSRSPNTPTPRPPNTLRPPIPSSSPAILLINHHHSESQPQPRAHRSNRKGTH